MKRYAARITAALVACAAGVALVTLLARLPKVRLTFHYGWGEDLVSAALAFAGGVACYVLVVVGRRRRWRRDLVFNVLFFLVGSMSLAFCLWTLTTVFIFGGAEVID